MFSPAAKTFKKRSPTVAGGTDGLLETGPRKGLSFQNEEGRLHVVDD